ncbi:Cof-type HAD-IIB family hydrolase [Lagierella sp.]|uniref:Cof-type HAD-IIB family hydrolase n=1 Tax=Lagierella sp. TaxID=2849657 RepID=UPI00262BAB34|nr:Cof-type HAD-IIB family hydrolase [Lagierella sp.]
MSRYKLLCCDMDECILNAQDEISPKDIEAINYILDSGINFVFASGRNISSMYRHIESLGTKKRGEFAITQNGSCVFDIKRDRILFKSIFEREIAEEILNYGMKKHLTMEIFTSYRVFIYNMDQQHEEDFLARKIPFIKVSEDDFLSLIKEGICKINYVSDSLKILNEFKEDLYRVLRDDIHYTFSSGKYLDMTCRGIDKSTGIEVLTTKLGIDRSEVIALGDNYNDLEMIKYAKVGIAVNNAVSELKEVADIVLDSSHWESPIVEIVERLSL